LIRSEEGEGAPENVGRREGEGRAHQCEADQQQQQQQQQQNGPPQQQQQQQAPSQLVLRSNSTIVRHLAGAMARTR
jgi:hypothetical protein